MRLDIEAAKAALTQPGVTCAVACGTLLLTSELSGVRPLLTWLDTQPEALKGAAVADRVIGKAAAWLMVKGGASQVYGRLVSQPAAQCLTDHGIPLIYDSLVPRIQNRDKTGLCPMETATLSAATADEAYAILKEKLG